MIFLIFAVAFLAASAALLLLMPSPKQENARAASLGDFQFPRSDYGSPVSIFWGTIRLNGPNTIWYGDFRADPIIVKTSSLFSTSKQTVAYRYVVGLHLALGIGPGVQMRRIWAGQDIAWEGLASGEATFTINKLDLFGGDKQGGGLQGDVFFYGGDFNQSVNTYVRDNVGGVLPNYGGFAHIVFKKFYLGTSLSIKAFNFELSRLTDNLHNGYGIMPNSLDLNPMEILYDIFVQKWARLGVDTSLIHIASWQAAAETVYAEGNGMSLKVEAGQSGKDLCEEVMRQIDGVLYQDPETQQIVAKLLRPDYDIGSLPIFDASNIKSLTNFQKTFWDSTFNQARVTFTNRGSDYKDDVATAQDFANINYQNKIRNTDVSLPGVTDGDNATRLAGRFLNVHSVPLFKTDMVANREAASLRPGDCFLLNWEPLNLVAMVMRVQSVNLGTLTDGSVALTVIQDQFATNDIIFAAPPATGWLPVDRSARTIPNRKIIECPRLFSVLAGLPIADTTAAMYISARKPGTQSQVYDAEATVDAFVTTYLIKDDAVYTPSARLAAAYSSTVGGDIRYDTATGITINSVDDPSVLRANASRADTVDGRGLFIVNNEIMSYRTYVDNGGGSYTLQGISRGFLDTAPASHALGDYLFFFNGQDGLGSGAFAETASVTTRLRDNTVSDTLPAASALTDLVTCNRRVRRPAGPTYLTLNASRTPTAASGATIAALWRERNRLAGGIVWYDDGSQTPEAGQTYQLTYSLSGGGFGATVTGITGNAYTIPAPPNAGTLTVTVQAVRDGLASLTSETLTMTIT